MRIEINDVQRGGAKLSTHRGGILRVGVVGGGFLRTGCGPGPLEPALGNSSEGNTTTTSGRTREGARPFLLMKISVNGQDMEVADGISVDGLLTHLGVTRKYTAVAVDRDVTPKREYAGTRLREGGRGEIRRPRGGGWRGGEGQGRT